MIYCGSISTFEGNNVFIALSTKNIKKQPEDKLYFSSPLKSLFHSFLHEFYHLLILLELYLKNDTRLNIELIGEQRHKESLKERRILRRHGFDSE
jgi:hypothetical protein